MSTDTPAVDPVAYFQRTRQILRSDLAPSQKLLLIAISDHLRDGQDYCWPALPTLAALTGASQKTVKRQRATLEALGVLYVERKAGQVNRYRIDWGELKTATPRAERPAPTFCAICTKPVSLEPGAHVRVAGYPAHRSCVLVDL